MACVPALAGGLLLVVVLAMAVAVHARAPALSPEPFGSASPSSAPSKAPVGSATSSGAPTAMEMETLLLAPAKSPAAAGAKGNPAAAPASLEDAPSGAPAFAPFASESPEESTFGGAPIALVPAAYGYAAASPEYAPSMAPAGFAPFASEESPAGAPGTTEAGAPGPASEMAAAPSSGDYDVLEEEALSPAGEGPSAEASASTTSETPAGAPGPASDDDASGASATDTRRSLVAVVIVAAVSALAAF